MQQEWSKLVIRCEETWQEEEAQELLKYYKSRVKDDEDEWDSKTDWANTNRLPPCWWHLLFEIERFKDCDWYSVKPNPVEPPISPEDFIKDKDQHRGSAMSSLLYGGDGKEIQP